MNFAKAAALFVGVFLVSLLVDNMAMDLRMYLLTRGGGVYESLAAYYFVHYVVFQLTIIFLVYGLLQGSQLGRGEEVFLVFAITAGKLLGRLVVEQAPTLPQAIFSIVISTQLSMGAFLLGYRLPMQLRHSTKTRNEDWSLETYAGLSVLFWFAVMPGVDALGNNVYSNLLRTAMALSLLLITFMFFKGWTNYVHRFALLTGFCVVALVLASVFADVLWRAGTLLVLPLPENIYYLVAQAFQGFFLALAASSGIWLNLILKNPSQVAATRAEQKN